MTPTTTDLSAIDTLVLVRLLACGEKGELASKIKKDLEPLLSHRWPGASLTGQVDHALVELVSGGLASRLAGKTRKAAPRFVPTEEGRRLGLEFLGVPRLKPKATWGLLRKTYLPGAILGMPATSDARLKALGSEPAFQAVLLRQRFGLPTAEIPRPDDATDALAWKLMGFEGEARKFDVKGVKAALFNRELGDGRATDFKKAATRLLAHRLGARRDDPKELRDAVLREWIDREGGGDRSEAAERPLLAKAEAAEADRPMLSLYRPTSADPAAPPSSATSERTVFEMAALAERVKEAARACPTGRYGENKVFISHVWRMVESDPDFAWMDLDHFKNFLAMANNSRLIDLGRADLVQAMDPDDVRSSEVHYLNATFHFIRI